VTKIKHRVPFLTRRLPYCGASRAQSWHRYGNEWGASLRSGRFRASYMPLSTDAGTSNHAVGPASETSRRMCIAI
jgi:hypothetical protein